MTKNGPIEFVDDFFSLMDPDVSIINQPSKWHAARINLKKLIFEI